MQEGQGIGGPLEQKSDSGGCFLLIILFILIICFNPTYVQWYPGPLITRSFETYDYNLL